MSGEATRSIINNSGSQTVSSGDIVTNAIVDEGETKNISHGAFFSKTLIVGGTQNILSGGNPIDTTGSSNTVNLYKDGNISGFNGPSGRLNYYGDNIAGNTVLANGALVNIVHNERVMN